MKLNKQDIRELYVALLSAFPAKDTLSRMVYFELDESLDTIAYGIEQSTVIFNLIKWAKSKGKLSKLILGAYQQNPGNPELKVFHQNHYETINQLIHYEGIADRKTQPLIACAGNSLKEEDWKNLFEILSPDDFAYLQIAFFRAFKAAYNMEFLTIRPDSPQMNNLDDIQNLLTQYNKPTLFLHFVEFALELFQKEDSNDLIAMREWCHRISKQYKVPSRTIESVPKIDRQGYLFVALEESGSDVIVYPELRVAEEKKPIEFGVSPVKCSFMDNTFAKKIAF